MRVKSLEAEIASYQAIVESMNSIVDESEALLQPPEQNAEDAESHPLAAALGSLAYSCGQLLQIHADRAALGIDALQAQIPAYDQAIEQVKRASSPVVGATLVPGTGNLKKPS